MDSLERHEYGVLEKVPQHEFSGHVWIGRTSGTVWLNENIIKTATEGTLYKNSSVSYASADNTEAQDTSIDVAAIMIDKPFMCKALTHANTKDTKTHTTSAKVAVKTSKFYTFDIIKADVIFDQLLAAKIIKH